MGPYPRGGDEGRAGPPPPAPAAYLPPCLAVATLASNLTAHDAWYVALAESLDAPLATLDRRIERAPGVRCPFRTPPGA